jgi:hypothetical protein
VSKLSRLSDGFPRQTHDSDTPGPPRVDSSLLWDLLDYAAASSPITTSGDNPDGIELDINTQFLSPLTSATPRPAGSTTLQLDNNQEHQMPNAWEDSVFEFDPFDFPDYQDMASTNLTKGFW